LVLLLLFWFYSSSQQSIRTELVECANQEVGVQETSENDGPRIKEYIESAGFNKPIPWCGAFLTFIFKDLNLNYPLLPARAASWTALNAYKNKYEAIEGDIFTIYYSSHGRVGHVGLIETTDADYIYTVEGNTNNNILDAAISAPDASIELVINPESSCDALIVLCQLEPSNLNSTVNFIEE